MHVVYFSNVTGNTKKFVSKLGVSRTRIPIHGDPPRMYIPYVLVVPSYGTGRNDVPPQVKRFLSDPENRDMLQGVIGSGNLNFGQLYGISARKIAEKFGVDMLYRFELAGTDEDVIAVRNGLTKMDERTI